MSDRLSPGQRLVSNSSESIVSSDGRFKLVMQIDGNLVLYKLESGQALWATGTDGQDVEFCIMQSDGNLVLYLEGSGRPVWASNTAGNPDSFLVVQNDGNLVVYKPNCPIWATGTRAFTTDELSLVEAVLD
jgi:hypothetical protein